MIDNWPLQFTLTTQTKWQFCPENFSNSRCFLSSLFSKINLSLLSQNFSNRSSLSLSLSLSLFLFQFRICLVAEKIRKDKKERDKSIKIFLTFLMFWFFVVCRFVSSSQISDLIAKIRNFWIWRKSIDAKPRRATDSASTTVASSAAQPPWTSAPNATRIFNFIC